MREYYDQWDAFSAPLSWKGRIKEGDAPAADPCGRSVSADQERPQGVCAVAHDCQARLQRWGGITSELLYPPPPQRAYRCEGYGDYIFAVSRLAPLKRLSLLIDALANPEAAGIRCVIAGEGEEHQALEHAIATRGLSSRVKLIGRIDDRRCSTISRKCRAVCFPPYDEDYGFVTVEAFASRQAGHYLHRQRRPGGTGASTT